MKLYALSRIDTEGFVTYELSAKEMLDFIGKMPERLGRCQYNLSIRKDYKFNIGVDNILEQIEDDYWDTVCNSGFELDIEPYVSDKEKEGLANMIDTVINSFIKRNISDDLHYYAYTWQGDLRFLQSVLKGEILAEECENARANN